MSSRSISLFVGAASALTLAAVSLPHHGASAAATAAATEEKKPYVVKDGN